MRAISRGGRTRSACLRRCVLSTVRLLTSLFLQEAAEGGADGLGCGRVFKAGQEWHGQRGYRVSVAHDEAHAAELEPLAEHGAAHDDVIEMA